MLSHIPVTKAQYQTWFDEVLRPTEPIFRRVPSDKLSFQLTQQSFTIGQLLCHIPASLRYMAKVVNHDELPFKSVREILIANRRHPSLSVDEAVADLAECATMFKNAIDKLSDDEFQKSTFNTPQLGEVSYWRYGAFALEHHIRHTMELHICLRMLGLPVNTMSLYNG